MAVTTGILAVAGGALAVEAFAADVAGGEVGVDFFSAAGLGFGAAGAGFEVVVVEAEVAGGFGGSVFSGFGDLETFGGASVFAVVAGDAGRWLFRSGRLRVGLHGQRVPASVAAFSLLLGIRFSSRVDRQEQWG